MGAPQTKGLRHGYGFEDVAIPPGEVTINPDQTNTDFSLGDVSISIPIIASAMDAVVSPDTAIQIDNLGGLAVLNLEGIQTKYKNPADILEQIAKSPPENTTALLQKFYAAPIKEELVADRVQQIKSRNAKCAVSMTPVNTKRLAEIAVDAGADVIVVQSTVTTARHISKSIRGLIFSDLLKTVKIPVLVGNCVGYQAALELMETGISGVLVGVGPGAACTTREVTGVGVPQVTATLECSAARRDYYQQTGRYVPIITDGGIRTGGDLCKALVCGADAVMIGTPLAQSEEAPGKGYNWGMASPHPALPRGTRIHVGIQGSLKQILYGPTSRTDGTQNFIGALQACMSMLGTFTIREMHDTEVIVAPSIKTEGKHYQLGLQ